MGRVVPDETILQNVFTAGLFLKRQGSGSLHPEPRSRRLSLRFLRPRLSPVEGYRDEAACDDSFMWSARIPPRRCDRHKRVVYPAHVGGLLKGPSTFLHMHQDLAGLVSSRGCPSVPPSPPQTMCRPSYEVHLSLSLSLSLETESIPSTNRNTPKTGPSPPLPRLRTSIPPLHTPPDQDQSWHSLSSHLSSSPPARPVPFRPETS